MKQPIALSKLLVVAALFSSSSATYNKVSQGVVRVDLIKEFIPHQEVMELEESELQDDYIEIEDLSYTQLRTRQNNMIQKGIKQIESINLVQENQGEGELSTITLDSNTEEKVQTHTRSKVSQLVSEVADATEDQKDDLQLQVPLESKNDAVYMGTVYLGSPDSQPANVVFDTGSEYLAVTSALCDDRTSGNFKFKKYDPNTSSFVERDQKEDRCKTQSYNMHKSDSNKILSKASSKLTYGSAKLQGFIWEDYTCIQPLKGGAQSAVELKLQLKNNKCALFQFLALYKAQGLGKHSDGILGLSPHKDMGKKKLHYLWSLKDNGIIDHAMVSFSVTSKDMGETPYALFGGYNSSQIVGGAAGLKTFKNYENWLGTWALEGQGMYYGAEPMQKPGEDTAYPAIIDTGSSQLSIPPDVFNKIQENWAKALPNIDCTSDATFCHAPESCDSIATKVKPIGFQMSDYVFEINPDQYLYRASEGKCYFVIHKCRLPGKNKDLFLIGDAFLRHFYSVYDFDKDQVSIGINVHSQGKVSMYKPGERPADLKKVETSQENMPTGDKDETQNVQQQAQVLNSSSEAQTNETMESNNTAENNQTATVQTNETHPESVAQVNSTANATESATTNQTESQDKTPAPAADKEEKPKEKEEQKPDQKDDQNKDKKSAAKSEKKEEKKTDGTNSDDPLDKLPTDIDDVAIKAKIKI